MSSLKPGPRSGSVKPRRSSPTLEDVAALSGVSRSTVSRAINGGARVSARTQAAIDAAIGELGFTPNRAARSLATSRADSIALVIPEPDGRVLVDPFFAMTLNGITEALKDTEVQLVLLIARQGEKEGQFIRYLRSGHVDGAIIVSHHKADALETELADATLPAVFIGRPWQDHAGLAFVDTDNRTGGLLAARHLTGRGYRRIATVTGPADMTAAQDRTEGWRQGLAEAGLEPAGIESGHFTTEGGAAAAARLLDADPGIDAIFAASDPMALGVLEVLRGRGLSVPGDVALVGYDNHQLASSSTPGLTTVVNPMVEMARRAAEMLLREIEEPGSHLEHVVYPPELVVRESA
ncbi:LacI family DNA-binding transcriptional regulator [Arthrobacter sp. zg-Y179]|uniref:LacI family DNA-binding transcriptional regulator n=1 Tax=Arthrobacter sp. zg-Y179 TaxID=2894188 RepID=UPI001E336E28|nr:LacI family DNA-binding transcriptional regulator [Arthrobacter sp. zg-Y179]MCC9173474.1 LacI family transcriptional regulator [Arthrobacter sp. zg-Y179]